MIISHKHRFIFVKTQKTAGTSLEIALSAICGPDDIITPISPEDEQLRQSPGLRKPQNVRVPFSRYRWIDWCKTVITWKRVRFYNHASAKEIRHWIGQEIWDQYYKFCFERNPYEKVISHYYWKGGARRFGSIKKFIRSGKVKQLFAEKQYKLKGQSAMNRIYQYEKFEEALSDLQKRFQPDQPLKLPMAKSNYRKDRRVWNDILTVEEQQMIADLFGEQKRKSHR